MPPKGDKKRAGSAPSKKKENTTVARQRDLAEKAAAAQRLFPENWPLPSVQRELTHILRPNTAPSYSEGFSRQGFFGRENSRLDFELPQWPPLRIYVACSLVGRAMLVFNEVPAESTIAELKKMVYERLMLTPHHALQLSSWGRPLDDEHTLVQCNLPSNARLQLHLSPARPDSERGLRRVRVASTCLRTRQINVDEWTTVGVLKTRLEAHLRYGEQVWFTSDGFPHAKTGVTVVVVKSEKADAKQGTTVVRIGDELLVEGGARSTPRLDHTRILPAAAAAAAAAAP